MRGRRHIFMLIASVAGTLSVMSIAPSAQAHAGQVHAGQASSMWRNANALSVRCKLDGATAEQKDIICQRVLAAAKINAPFVVQERAASAASKAKEVSLILTGTVNGSDFKGTVGLSRSASGGEHDDMSRSMPITLDLKDKGSRADRSIHAALVRLLPWRQLTRATNSPPREY